MRSPTGSASIPPRRLAAVHLSILRRENSAPAPAPPVPSSPRTNLPAQLTSFVGREEESRRVGKLLRGTGSSPHRPRRRRDAAGGESAAALVEEMPDGAWFVPLAPVSDPGDVVQAVLSALGVPGPSGRARRAWSRGRWSG